MVKRWIYRLLPTALRIQGFRQYSQNLWLDVLDAATGRRSINEPPRRLNISGTGPFRELGQHNLQLCREYASLTPQDAVIDLGCGMGRTALAMRGYLEPTGKYVGLDVIPFAVRWCRQHLSSKAPSFSFVHADIYNLMYNPRGKHSPDTYFFPFPDQSFTFCLATSLFTHLLPNAVERYLKEVGRVLSTGGQFLSTWFLLSPETKARMAAGRAQIKFPYVFQHHSQRSLHAPEQAVAFDLNYVQRMYAEAGLTLKGIHFGGWSGPEAPANSGQDILIAARQ